MIICYLCGSYEIREVGNLDFSPNPALGELTEAISLPCHHVRLCKMRELIGPSVELRHGKTAY